MELPKKILVVETYEVIVLLISHSLARHSYVVHTTLDALEAADMLQTDDYDAILIDPKVPNCGVKLVGRIESLDPALLRKVIIVGENPFDEATLGRLKLHAVVRKPFEVGALVNTVQACVTANG